MNPQAEDGELVAYRTYYVPTWTYYVPAGPCIDTRVGYIESCMQETYGGFTMISDRTTVRLRGLATRSLRLALRLEGEAKRDALAKHFEEFTPGIFSSRSCPLRAM